MKVLSLLKLQLSGLLKFEEGSIKIFGQRFGMLPISYFFSLSNVLDKMGKKKELYLISWINGTIMMKYFELSTKAKHPIDVYTIGMEYASLIGDGKFKTLEYDIGKFAKFQIENEPFLEYDSDNKEAPYLIVAGFQGGGGSISHKNIINCLPIKIDPNRKTSVFLNATVDELEKRNLKQKFEGFIGASMEEILHLQERVYEIVSSVSSIDEIRKVELKKLYEILKHI